MIGIFPAHALARFWLDIFILSFVSQCMFALAFFCFCVAQPPVLIVQFVRYIDRFEAALWNLARIFHAHWHAPRQRLPSSSLSSSSSATHRAHAASATPTAAGGSVSSLMQMFASDD